MGKWLKERIGVLADTFAGGTPSRSIPSYFTGNIPWVTSSEVNEHYIVDTREKITVDAYKSSSTKMIPKDAVLVAMYGATAGQVSRLMIEACSNQAVLACVPNQKIVSSFLYYLLVDLKDRIIFRAQGSGQTNLSKEIVDNTYAQYPLSLDEQRHIAEILTTCDEVIEKSETVVEKYRAIKAGMLKDLFTRGIGKNGKLRPPPESAPRLYKDTALGKVPQEWEVKTIDEMFAFKNGVSKGKEYFGHGVPIVNFTDVFNRPRITPDVLKGRVEMDRHELDSFAVKSGDVFFTRTSETPEEIGMAAVVIGEFVDTVFSGFVLRGRPIGEDLENEFKVFCFRTDAVRKWIIGDCSYTTRALTNGAKLSAIKMGVPSKCEQQRIAERLSAIDAKIADEFAVIAKYRKVKTGLMARLLTPPDGEVE